MNPGDKVVCVNAHNCRCWNYNGRVKLPLHEGSLYVVKQLSISPRGNQMVELIGVVHEGHASPGFRPYRFRKLDDLKKQKQQEKEKDKEIYAN